MMVLSQPKVDPRITMCSVYAFSKHPGVIKPLVVSDSERELLKVS